MQVWLPAFGSALHRLRQPCAVAALLSQALCVLCAVTYVVG